VYWMIEIARGSNTEGVQAAAVFSDAVGKILAPIKSAIDAFEGLREYESVASERMQALAADIHRAVYWMIAIAKGSDQEGTEAAALWSDAVKRIFDGLRGGLDVLSDLRDYETVGSEQMRKLLDDVLLMVDHMALMAKGAADQVLFSIAWLDDIREFAANWVEGVNTIKGLPAFPGYPGMPNPPGGGGTGDGVLDSGDTLTFRASRVGGSGSGPTYSGTVIERQQNLIQYVTTPMHQDAEFGWMQDVWAK
jgi:hypothetical protein